MTRAFIHIADPLLIGLKTGRHRVPALVFLALMLVRGLLPAQTIRNNGTMNNTGTLNCTTFYNYKGTTPGTLNNTGTVNASSLFDNNLAGATINNNAGGKINLTGSSSTYSNGLGATYNTTATSRIAVAATLSVGSGAFVTSAGEILFNGSGAQTIAPLTYGILSTGTGGTKSLSGTTTVQSSLSLGVGTTLSVAGDTLTINGTPGGTGTFAASAAGSVVIYNGSGNQSVLGASYATLKIQNGGTKTALGAVDVSGTLSNTATFDLSSFTLTTGASASIVNSGATIQTAGNVTFGARHQIDGTFIYYAASGSQTLGAASYLNLTLTGGSGTAGQKNFPSDTVSVRGSYALGGANRSYGTGVFAYAGTAAQTVFSSEAYAGLLITGAADTSTHKTVNGALTLTGALAIAANNTLDMLNYSGTFGSGSTNAGKIIWQGNNAYVAGPGMTEFTGSTAAQVAAGTAYGNMRFSGSGTKTISGAVGATGGTASYGVTVESNLTIGTGASLTITGMDINVVGPITNNGTITVQ